MSPYLFVLAVEIMAEAFRKNARVKGIVINGKEIKLSQYADDMTFMLNGSKESLKESLNLLDTFGKASGLRLNCSKTEALWIGSNARSDLKICFDRNFKWPTEKVKTLGVWLSIYPGTTLSQNYNEKVERVKAILGCWKFRRLSLLGKVAVLKSLVASQLVYILSPLESKYKILKEINSIF